MVVTWVTMQVTFGSTVEYGTNNLDSVAKGIEEMFEDGGTEKRQLYEHRVTLKYLKPGQRYGKNWSTGY